MQGKMSSIFAMFYAKDDVGIFEMIWMRNLLEIRAFYFWKKLKKVLDFF